MRGQGSGVYPFTYYHTGISLASFSMSSHPLTRRDTRVRFSMDHGRTEESSNRAQDDSEHLRLDSRPPAEPEPAHAPRAHNVLPGRSRRASWTQPSSVHPPQGYLRNPNFDAQWDRPEHSNHIPSVKPMPPGARFDLDDASEVGPLDPWPPRSQRNARQDSQASPAGNPYRPPESFDRHPPNQPYSEDFAPSQETLHEDILGSQQQARPTGTPRDSYNPIPGYPAPPQTILRSVIRRSYSEDFTAPTVSRGGSGSALEAGPGGHRPQRGGFSSLMQTYGLSRGGRRISEGTASTATGLDSRYQSQVVSRANSNDSAGALLRLRRTRRQDSTLSMGGETLLDDDDPRVTGAKPNRIDDENKARETFKSSLKTGKGSTSIVLNVNSK